MMRPGAAQIDENPQLRAELLNILGGGSPRFAHMALSRKIHLLKGAKRIVASDGTIIKFVYAQRALEWMANHTVAKGSVLIRHPAAVVASQLHHPYTKDGEPIQHPEWSDEAILNMHPIISKDEMIRWPALKEFQSKLVTPVERLAVTACLDIKSVLESSAACQKYPLVLYEALKSKPDNFIALAESIGLEVVNDLREEVVSSRSKTTSDQTGKRGVARLSESDLSSVQSIIELLDLSFFCADGSVDFDYFYDTFPVVLG
ncbi:hypothetical protein [Halioxenophilus aromaticivorans]|uniref:hypothetical protein n=1 Tax=Halioxenophilus aromaticivorans TaxID=1306992 RepID=UPI0031E62B2F